MSRLFTLIVIVFASASAIVSGQSAADCKVGGYEFPCPKNFTVKQNGSDSKPLVLANEKNTLGLFMVPLGDKRNDQKLSSKGLDRSYDALFGFKYSKLDVKASKDFWGDDKYSKYEESKDAKAVFIPDTLSFVHMHYAVIAFEGKRFLAGFARIAMSGATAKARFDSWIGGGGDGDNQLHSLIAALTKEERPRFIPGGPPPPAPMPKKPN